MEETIEFGILMTYCDIHLLSKILLKFFFEFLTFSYLCLIIGRDINEENIIGGDIIGGSISGG